MYKLSI